MTYPSLAEWGRQFRPAWPLLGNAPDTRRIVRERSNHFTFPKMGEGNAVADMYPCEGVFVAHLGWGQHTIYQMFDHAHYTEVVMARLRIARLKAAAAKGAENG